MRTAPRVTVAVLLMLGMGCILTCCGGPQSSPEKVARAMAEALVSDRCDLAEEYTSPDTKYQAQKWCTTGNGGPFEPGRKPIYMRIDKTLVRESNIWGRPAKEVFLLGEFRFIDGFAEGDTANQVIVIVEELSGEWFVWSWDNSG